MIANADALVANRTSSVLQTLRRDALEILASALRAVDSGNLLSDHLSREGDLLEADGLRWNLDEVETFRVLAIGKASVPMTRALLRIVEPDETLVAAAEEEFLGAPNASIIQAPHPIPGAGSLKAGSEALSMANRTGPRDVLLVLLSGGGSAMLEHSDLPLDALQETTRLLLRSGMDIGSMNTVRRHLSLVKGGWLAKAATRGGGACLALALSDVVGDHPEDIASGPTAPDPTTFEDARRALEDDDLWNAVPEVVRDRIQRGIEGEVAETPKPGHPGLERVSFRLVGSIRDAVREAIAEGERRGYHPHTYGTQVTGEARTVGRNLVAAGISTYRAGEPVAPPALLV
ncbi:MAG: glycerate-2-kinase family protein, partial [Thermoplasmata archaeon]|nr:glycerate-2-kinase family protein [Thermoplasmata archaeon]